MEFLRIVRSYQRFKGSLAKIIKILVELLKKLLSLLGSRDISSVFEGVQKEVEVKSKY